MHALEILLKESMFPSNYIAWRTAERLSWLRAGLPQEGVTALQEAGLWRYAATLTAHTLKGNERAAALERWAAHIHQVTAAM